MKQNSKNYNVNPKQTFAKTNGFPTMTNRTCDLVMATLNRFGHDKKPKLKRRSQLIRSSLDRTAVIKIILRS